MQREIKVRQFQDGKWIYLTIKGCASTGMKDRTDKEIYEGDILGQKHKGPDYSNSYILWQDGIFYKRTAVESNITYRDIFIDGSQYEIIGNIYENPELIYNIHLDE
jgi:uncharacterized phage protein (TIGR01671 family)